MILLDTHIWLWWASGDSNFKDHHLRAIDGAGVGGVGISVISCWEVAKSVEKGKLRLSLPTRQWIDAALQLPNVVLVQLTPAIAVDSTELPQPIHADPADQVIIATARSLDCELLTADSKILSYPHVKLAVRSA